MAIEDDWARAGYTATLPCREMLRALSGKWESIRGAVEEHPIFLEPNFSDPLKTSFDEFVDRQLAWYWAVFDDQNEEHYFPRGFDFEVAGQHESLAFQIAVLYCAQALTADLLGKHHTAWAAAFDAARWEGFLTGRFTNEHQPTKSMSEKERGRKGGEQKARPRSELKQAITDWCQLHHPKYYERGANALAIDAVTEQKNWTNPFARSTIRGWITKLSVDWRDKGTWKEN